MKTRRNFLKFIGVTSTLSMTSSCSSVFRLPKKSQKPNLGLAPQFSDQVVTIPQVKHHVVMKWGDVINKKGDRVGFNNDYLHAMAMAEGELLLWVNFEAVHPLFVHGKMGQERTRKDMEQEMKEVGGGFFHLRKNAQGQWALVYDSKHNQRFDANTPFELISDLPIAGSRRAIGTLANCAGGYTPWGTILTCEENYDHFWGEVSFANHRREVVGRAKESLDWFREIKPARPPEHYGWVVEIKPGETSGKKLTALGRFAHEGATLTRTADGRVVVYMGDDKADECIYKFVSTSPDSLHKGELFVADTVAGKWLSLRRESNPKLMKMFKNQTELLVRTREAAKLVGATPQARPEDIAINADGDIFVALTNNKKRGDFFGSILKIQEKDKNPASLDFKTEVFHAGSVQSGFACPDNFALDRWGNFWFTTDISGPDIGTEKYKEFGHNGLFVIPTQGKNQGQIIRVATAPVDAEFTGPEFSPDGKTLFLCVQHPGELSKKVGEWTSHWPDGGMPRSGVIALDGPAIEAVHQI